MSRSARRIGAEMSRTVRRPWRAAIDREQELEQSLEPTETKSTFFNSSSS